MIREGKRAKVTYCKEAKTLAPVSAITQSPRSGKVRDGYESARVVKEASIVIPDLQQRECSAKVHSVSVVQYEGVAEVQPIKVLQHESPAEMTVAAPIGSVPAQTQDVNTEVLREEQVQLKNIHYRNAKKDITLKALFHDWKES